MIFVVGLPLGLIIFGPAFNTFVWLSIVISVLFMMNLHNTWEVILSLKYGGLDYVMATQAVASAEAVTPNDEDIKKLYQRVKGLNLSVQKNTLRGPMFQKGILDQETDNERLVPLPENI